MHREPQGGTSACPDQHNMGNETISTQRKICASIRCPMSNSDSDTRCSASAVHSPSDGARADAPSPARPIKGGIGFIGLGHMGTAMATNLAAAGRPVVAYVRRENKVGGLKDLGLWPTTDFADLLDCELVISMLPDDHALRHVALG